MIEEKLKLESVIKEYKKIFEETKKDINLVETNNRGEEDLDFEIIENLIVTFENKLKYFKKCVDKCTALYYIKLNKRETEQPNREGRERSTKESIEREVQST